MFVLALGEFLHFFCVSGDCVILFLCFQLSVPIDCLDRLVSEIMCWMGHKTLLTQLNSVVIETMFCSRVMCISDVVDDNDDDGSGDGGV